MYIVVGFREDYSMAHRVQYEKKRLLSFIEKCNGWHWIALSLIGVLIFSIIPFGLVFYYSGINSNYKRV